MKFLILHITSITIVATQSFNWSFIIGGERANEGGVYSVIGTPSPFVYPGARETATGVVHSQTNEFVLYAGRLNGLSYFNDLWSFNLDSNMWTWLSGSNQTNQAGVYGTKRTASMLNSPGARSSCAIDMFPDSEILVLFGGEGHDSVGSRGYLNDLWTFDFSTRQWTWISGSNITRQLGIFGSKGVASPANVPGSRTRVSMIIHSQTRNVLVFGGYGIASTAGEFFLNDFWSFDMNTNLWTWLSGSSSTGSAGVYGMKQVPSPENVPSSRYGHSLAITNNGNLLLFGGFAGTYQYVNDLWSFDFSSNLWTWINGEQWSAPYQTGVYGTKGIFSPQNAPPGRYGHRMCYIVNLKSVVMFGGYSIEQSLYYNDVWLYDVALNQWAWVGGANLTNQAGVYGLNGMPGARYTFAFDCNKQCFLFGGSGFDGRRGFGSLNDLWLLDLPYVEPEFSSIPSSSQTKNSTLLISSTSVHEAQIATSEKYIFELSDVVESSTTLTKPVTKSKSTSNRNENQTSNFFRNNQFYLIYFIVGFGFILICFLIYTTLIRRKAARRSTTTSKASETTTSTLYGKTSTTTYATNSSVITAFTKFTENQGISIPGFLQFKFGIDFRVTKEIARGGMGSVSLGDTFNSKLEIFGKSIIIKQMINSNLTKNDVDLFYQEVSVMYYLHKERNIAKFLGYTEQPFCLLMKYYPNGSLDEWIHNKSIQKSLAHIMCFLRDICNGLEAMHSRDLIHCDLKPQNILLDQDKHGLFCVLTDFGITQIVSDKNLLVKSFNVVNVRGMSLKYASPEAIKRLRLKQNIPVSDLYQLDIYAMGIIIYELLTRSSP